MVVRWPKQLFKQLLQIAVSMESQQPSSQRLKKRIIRLW